MIYERIQKEAQIIEKQIQNLQEKLEQFPSGKLICTKSGNYYKWYLNDGKHYRYLPKAERKLAEQLAVKKYYTYLLENLQNEKKAIEFYLQHQHNGKNKAEQMLADMPEYQKLISSIYTPLSKELSDWMSHPYERNLNYPEHLIHRTGMDFFVRSKSEAMIAKILMMNKIPFRYECALHLGEAVVYPDFTIRHPSTGEFYYWEHFGMMDDSSYCKKTYSKLQLYSQNGIIPSINLITTYETQRVPLSTEIVDKMIEYYFV